MPTNKAIITIYKILREYFTETDNNEIIESIIVLHNKGTKKSEHFIEQDINNIINENLKTELSYRLFYSKKIRVPDWVYFIKNNIPERSRIAKAENVISSYIMFAYDGNYIFAITGGIGNFVIQDYADKGFGISVLSNLIKKESSVIKSVIERELVGSVLGSVKFFRYENSLLDESSFSRIYKEIQASIDKNKMSKLFGFTSEELKDNTVCLAKSSFKIQKKINLEQFSTIINNLKNIPNESFAINSIIPISNRGSDKKLSKALNRNLLFILFEAISEDNTLDFDFTHSDFIKFFEADSYYLFNQYHVAKTFDSSLTLPILVDFFKSNNVINLKDFDEFQEDIANLRIKSLDSNGDLLTNDSFLNHLHCELTHKESNYFFIDGKWYKILDNFISELNYEFKQLIYPLFENHIISNKIGNNESENHFSQNFFNDSNLVLDKVLADNIELCDILLDYRTEPKLVHIKKGFNNTTRDLTAQIEIAAKRLNRVITSGDFSFIDSVYDKIISKANTNDQYFQKVGTQNISKQLFREIFKRDKPKFTFCLAIVDTNKNEKSLNSDIEKYKSNIAKFSIINLYRNLKNLNIDLKIVQIFKENS